MIPLKLQLKNFLSYGARLQTIDFTPHQLICLSGKNGHGKSALLDAITWALWGQARKISGAVRADDSLLKLGQVQMLVVLDFEFNARQYKIRREFFKEYGSRSVLEFGMINAKNGEFIPLTDKTIKLTQKKIEDTIGISFETFINSAFLRQGNSNEFSKKSSKERKEILANILSADTYEVIRRHASEKIKSAQTEKQVLQKIQEQRAITQEKFPEITAQLESVQKELQSITHSNSVIQTQEEELQKAIQTNAYKQHAHELLMAQQAKLHQEKVALQEELRLEFCTWRKINKTLQSCKDKRKLEQEHAALLSKISTQQLLLQSKLLLQEKLLQANTLLSQQELSVKNTMQQEEMKLSHDLEKIKGECAQHKQLIEYTKERVDAYEKECAAYKHESELLRKIILRAASSQQEFKVSTAQLEKRKAAYQQFVAMGNFLTQELKSRDQKLLLKSDENNPSCPLCEQNLSASRRRFLTQKFETEKNVLIHKLHRLHKIIPTLKELLLDQHATLQNLKKEQEAALSAQSEEKKIEEKSNALSPLLQKEKNTLQTLEQKSNVFIQLIETKELEIFNTRKQLQDHIIHATQIERSKVTALEAEIQNQTFDEKELSKNQLALQQVESVLHIVLQSKREQEKQERRKQSIELTSNALRRIKKASKEFILQNDPYQEIRIETQLLQEKINALAQEKGNLEQKKNSLLEQKGRLESAQGQLALLAKEYESEQKNILVLESEIQDYTIIASATGKDGIQSLLIEHAIPEIEQEANMLLAKLTNNHTQIIIESLRDLKKGGTKETLDIKISDPAGIRPYELFSGGEAFRIDLAIRVAISKLLARRAGTSLQTLIIDEGFGSQDEQGLASIVDALHAIQEDFSKIIIVSHLPELKDQFPIHFFVQKSPEGSFVQVIEQG